jgi:hypothetical protein
MIKKFNQMNEQREEYNFTISDLKRLIQELPDDAPVVLVNTVNKGDNQYLKNNLEVGLVNIEVETGYAYYTANEPLRDDVKRVNGLIIYEN